MKPHEEYWKKWFDDQVQHAGSDYALNRGTTIRVDQVERQATCQLLASFAPRPSDLALDAGCGSGRNISLLSPLVREIVGVDFSEQMLAKAGERVKKERLNNVRLMQGSVTDLAFPDHTFDRVLCASVLQYLDDEGCARALRELLRVCKPGGRVILHVKNGTSLYGVSLKIMRVVARCMGRSTKPEYYRSRRWHEETLQAAGGTVLDYDGLGFLTFVPLPTFLVEGLLRLETVFLTGKPLRKLAVNYKMTVVVR